MTRVTAFILALSIVCLVLPLQLATAGGCGTGVPGKCGAGACSTSRTKSVSKMRERCQKEDADSLIKDAKENRRKG